MISDRGQLLVLHQGALGDFVLALSVVQAVRDQLRRELRTESPGRSSQHQAQSEEVFVKVVASAEVARLAAGRSAVDRFISPEAVGLHTLFGNAELDKSLQELLSASDCVLSFLGGSGEMLSRRLCEFCAGSLDRKASASPRIICVDPRPTAETLSSGRHITAQWAYAIRSQGLDVGPPAASVIRIEPNLRSGSRYIVIHPGSGGRGKCWPIESFIRVASELGETEVQWLLGPAEVESGLADVVQKHAKIAGQRVLISPELAEAAEVIAGAVAYVGNDAGMTHLAAAIGTPTLAVFVSTNPNVWRPLGAHVEVIVAGETAATVASVLAAVRRFVSMNAAR